VSAADAQALEMRSGTDEYADDGANLFQGVARCGNNDLYTESGRRDAIAPAISEPIFGALSALAVSCQFKLRQASTIGK